MKPLRMSDLDSTGAIVWSIHYGLLEINGVVAFALWLSWPAFSSSFLECVNR